MYLIKDDKAGWLTLNLIDAQLVNSDQIKEIKTMHLQLEKVKSSL